MYKEKQLIELIERFLNYCDYLLSNGKIDFITYEKITRNKKEFLYKFFNDSISIIK